MLLAELAKRVMSGQRLHLTNSVDSRFGSFELLPVHAAQLDAGIVNMWHAYYGSLGRSDLRPRHLQLFAPDLLLCDRCDPGDGWRLDAPSPLFERSPRPRPPARSHPRPARRGRRR